MAKSQSPAHPPSPEACQQLLAVMRSTAGPLPAKALAKLLAPPCQIPEKQLAPLLDEYVAAGNLHIYPAKTARGRPRYWDRDARAMGRAAALEALQRADRPLTAREVGLRLVVPLKFTEDELTEVLDGHVSVGRLHAIPPATSKSKRRFWNHDVLEFGRQALLKALDTQGPQGESKLNRAAKGLNAAQFRQVLNSAIAAGDVWRHPPLGKTKQEVFGRKPPSPEPYLREIGDQLTSIVARLTAVNVSHADLRRALVQLIEEAGVPFATAAAECREHTTRGPAAAVDLVGLMRRIEPGAEQGALVGARDLRRVARLDKPEFDRAVLELARKGRLSLHRHDYATSLSSGERDELVTDGDGTYYVGMSLIQG